LAATFYATKTREVIIEKRYHHEPLWVQVASVIAMYYDPVERQPSAPWMMPRLKQAGEMTAYAGLHVLCYLLSVETFLARGTIARNVSYIFHLDDQVRPLRIVIGCVSACFFAFYSLHLYGDILRIGWCLGGYIFPPLMDEPEQSLSVREFWKRWHTVMQKLLMKYVFVPCKNSGLPPTVAAALTFFASGLIHILPIIMSKPNDWLATMSMISYFLIQLSVITLEKPLGVYSWNKQHKWAARMWTIANLFGPSYLLVMPCLRLAGTDF